MNEQSAEMLTPKQAAKRIGVSTSLVYQLCHEGLMPHFRLGGKGKRGRVIIRAVELDAFVESCRCETKQRPLVLKHISVR